MTSDNLPHLWVVILSWNGKEDTLACLGSLARGVEPSTNVLLVDNGSTDGTSEAVRKEFPWVTVLETGENLGFTGGNNVGIRYALENGADYVLLLNNDTIVDPLFLREMLSVASSSDRIGFVSPKIYFLDPPDLLWFAGARFSTRTGYGRVTGYRERDRGQYDEIREIDRPCGCAMLVPRALCEKAGLMDDGIFLYVDEVEWMLRAREYGFRAFYAPNAKVWHKVSASMGRENQPDAIYYGIRNTLYALNLHARYLFAPINWLRNLTILVIFFVSVVRSCPSRLEGARAIFSGAADYLRGVTGPRKTEPA